MFLAIRMILYFAAAFIAGQGWASFDTDANTLTVNLDDIAVILGGIGAYVVTFITSRIAKARNGMT